MRGAVLHHAQPVSRAAADPAGRDRAQPPPHAVGAALHRRGLGRLHGGRRRAHHDAPGRLHHHAVLDLARPRQPGGRRAGGLDGRPRHPDPRTSSTRSSRRIIPEDVQPVTTREGTALARYGSNLAPLDAGRALRQDLAGLQLPLRAQPRGARGARQERRPGRLPRLEDAVHQSANRRPRDADHRRVHPAAAEGLPLQPYRSTDAHRLSRSPRAPAASRSATRHSPSSRATASSCRPGSRSRFEAKAECVLFSYSDRSAQAALGLWRERRG